MPSFIFHHCQYFLSPCVLLHGAEAVVVLDHVARAAQRLVVEGESQEVRGTSQPAWESGHGEGGGNIKHI